MCSPSTRTRGAPVSPSMSPRSSARFASISSFGMKTTPESNRSVRLGANSRETTRGIGVDAASTTSDFRRHTIGISCIAKFLMSLR